MSRIYEAIELPGGYSVKETVELLLEHNEKGGLVSVKFNGVTLYSNTVTMDGAYKEIVGMTKAEHDALLEEHHQKYERSKREHEENTPDLTKEWIAKGNEVLDADKQKLWAHIVPIRLGDLYQGMELGNCLDIVKILNEGGSLEEAKVEIEKQGHSGMSFSLVCSMVKAFCDRGPEFDEYVRK